MRADPSGRRNGSKNKRTLESEAYFREIMERLSVSSANCEGAYGGYAERDVLANGVGLRPRQAH